MRPVIVISLVLATLTGCAGTLKYERALKNGEVSYVEADTVCITSTGDLDGK
jgi:uncharacterized membrane protein